jgi:polysaccharide export outer membrane protein
MPTQILNTYRILLLALLASNVGCQTLSSLGLPVSSGPYKLSKSARHISESQKRAASLPRELSEELLPVYIVEPGDVLYLEPAKFDSDIRLPSDQPVQPDGTISVGRFGRVQVAGMTVPQIRRAVEAKIAQVEGDKADEVVVRLVDWKSKVYYVMGEVNSPGAYPIVGGETVLDAIVAAGDITRRANRHQMILSRPTGPCEERIVLPICYDNVIQLGDSSSNYQIQPGDRLFVPGINLCDDVVQSILPIEHRCPRCAPPQRGQQVPQVDCCRR